ncbi:MAG: UDP-N-acetylmuramate--L-alanine ligase [Bacteroidales bacterium]|nr:UDP-N-acetylmuramate--L-alanine ligase [Bacteroidales bacterium]MDP2237744.1 UDP-N-acetylmuramate--L-alanine ligase [Bacteroidales bacterium]
MKFEAKHTIYFLGIGGIGMSALARYFHLQGARIFGYDKTSTALTQQLELEGMTIHFEDDISLIPSKIDLVIYTPAIPADHKGFQYLRHQGVKMMKRAEVLGELSKDQPTIAIAGTHGKTTITSMLAHILSVSGKPITAFIGGIANNFSSNIVQHPNAEWFVVEADEFDKSFLNLRPDIAVISSMDADHLDIYESHSKMLENYAKFADNVSQDGCVVIKYGLNLSLSIQTITYGLNVNADVFAQNIRVENGRFVFELCASDQIAEVRMLIPGRHNIENALAAAAVALQVGIEIDAISKALETYKGVYRRFDIRINTNQFVYIDDYAHHPEELRACISAARELFPGRKITGIFQPHLYTRTRDFMDGFSESLSQLDEVILLDIYPARELPIPGVTSSILLDNINLEKKCLISKDSLIAYLEKSRPDVLLTLGAGDIDQLVGPIQKHFTA